MIKYFSKRILFGILFLIQPWYISQLDAQVVVERQNTVSSDILKHPVRFSVLLPTDYSENQETYSVIYLLHGYGGDNTSWLDRCNINLLIDSLRSSDKIREYIYVLPDAGKSYYLNNFDSSIMYEDFFIREFIPYIDSHYRTKVCREGRTLMGLSMGGFGAISLAVKYPGLFGTVVAMSAGIRNSDMFVSLSQQQYETLFASVYGPGLAGESRITDHWKSNSPYLLLDSTKSESLKSIHWFIECGIDDPLLQANEAFHNLLLEYSIPHDYHIRPGNHNWAFWYRSFIHGLLYLHENGNKECQREGV